MPFFDRITGFSGFTGFLVVVLQIPSDFPVVQEIQMGFKRFKGFHGVQEVQGGEAFSGMAGTAGTREAMEQEAPSKILLT